MVKINNIRIVFCVIGLLVFISCSQPKLDIKEYAKWIENPESGVAVTKKISDFEFAVLYKPIDYVIALESKNKTISKDSMLKRADELKGYQYYTFKVRSFKDKEFYRTGMGTENEYYRRLEYFISEAQNDIKLVEGNDTIPCAMYHFERNYGISPYSHMVLMFKENNKTDDKIFIYDDKILGVGKIAIKIQANEIEHLPKLNI